MNISKIKGSHIQQLADKERDKLLKSVDSFEDALWLAYFRGKQDIKIEEKMKFIDKIMIDLRNILSTSKVRQNVIGLLEDYEALRNDLTKELI